MMGPIIHLWTMRFEGNHGFFKHLTNKFRNYKNIAKTLAVHQHRHQQLMWYNWNNNVFDIKICEIWECGPSTKVHFIDYCYKLVIQNNIEHFADDTIVVQLKWLQLGFLYRKKFMIVSGRDDGSNLPIFSEIIDICLINETPLLIVQPWKTKTFDEFYHAYHVENYNNNLNVVTIDDMFYKECYEGHLPNPVTILSRNMYLFSFIFVLVGI